jgi:hypothetical protein
LAVTTLLVPPISSSSRWSSAATSRARMADGHTSIETTRRDIHVNERQVGQLVDDCRFR